MIVRAGFPGFVKVAAFMLAAGAVLVVGGLAIVPMGIVGGSSFVFAAAGNCPGASPPATPSSPAAGTPSPAGTSKAAGRPSPAGTSKAAGRPSPAGTSEAAGRPSPAGTSKAAGRPSLAGTAKVGRPRAAGGGRVAGASGTPAVTGAPSGGMINTVAQPAASTTGRNGIPASYLALYQEMGRRYGVPWVILAGIGKVESNHGQSNLPGVGSGQNGFGAAGPMQIGITGASGNNWGGPPVHPASEQVNGVATDGNGDGVASVYQPADAIAGAARFLLNNGVLTNVSGALFAYNHLESYVQAVLYWAGVYASGGYVVTTAGAVSAPQCLTTTALTVGSATAGQAVGTAIGYAQLQLGKPYLWGGTGPDAFDCSGLVMMSYRAAGISIPRTSQQQWAWGPRIPARQAQPGDLVFFAGSDGTRASPGHVGIVIGHGLMIEAYATGFPVRIAPYGGRNPVGFTRPWAHAGVVLPHSTTSQPASPSPGVPATGVPVPSIPPTPTGAPSLSSPAASPGAASPSASASSAGQSSSPGQPSTPSG